MHPLPPLQLLDLGRDWKGGDQVVEWHAGLLLEITLGDRTRSTKGGSHSRHRHKEHGESDLERKDNADLPCQPIGGWRPGEAPVAQGEISPCVCITTHVWEKPNTCFFGFSTHVWLFPHVCAKTHTSVVKTTLMVTVLCVDFTTHMW